MHRFTIYMYSYTLSITYTCMFMILKLKSMHVQNTAYAVFVHGMNLYAL